MGWMSGIPDRKDIVKSNYIKLGIKDIENNFDENKGYDISILPLRTNKNWNDQNISLLEKGCSMPNIPEYLEFYNAVGNSFRKDLPLFDSKGNKVPVKACRDLYYTVREEIMALNTLFERRLHAGKGWKINEAVGLDDAKNIIYNSRDFKTPLDHFVSLTKLSKGGFPDGASPYQEFIEGENIFFKGPSKAGDLALFSGNLTTRTELLCCEVGPQHTFDTRIVIKH